MFSQRYVIKSYVDALVLEAYGGDASRAKLVSAKAKSDLEAKRVENARLQVRGPPALIMQ